MMSSALTSVTPDARSADSSRPGIGSLFVDCIKANDYPVIMGITIFYAAFYMLIVLLVDLAYSLIDPIIRLAKGKES